MLTTAPPQATGLVTGKSAGQKNRKNLTADKTFTLTCSGAGGTVSDSAIIAIVDPPPTLTFSADPDSIAADESTILTWSSSNATRCTESGDWSGNRSVSGSGMINSLLIISQFTLECAGIAETVTETATVTVVSSNNGNALLIWLPPNANTDGSQLTDLAGYKIYYSTSSDRHGNVITLSSSGLTSYLVENLASTVWYFTVTSFNTADVESDFSEEVSKAVN